MSGDGGPAFPQPIQAFVKYRNHDGDDVYSSDGEYSNGMSLRDYFAAQALVTVVFFSAKALNQTYTPEQLAAWSYEQADAMLAEREK